jgi:multidrug efflux pump subunit AcrB
MNTDRPEARGLLAWFASNSVAANLLMLLIFIGGIVGFNLVDKEVFPRFNLQKIEITALYPNASPLEVEQSLCVRIENAIAEREGIKRLNTEITEGQCRITVAILPDYDQQQMINALRASIQSIPRLPKGIENITVQAALRDEDSGVIWVALHGATEALDLQRYGEHIKADLEHINGVRLVRNYNEIPYEIAIEVSAEKLRQYQLSLHEVTEAIHRTSLNQSNGLVKTPAGELSLRIQAKASDIASLNNIVIRTNPDGTELRLGAIATIRDGLEERLSEWHHNGETAQGWEIHTSHSSVNVARQVKRYVAEKQALLPQSLVMTTWWDNSQAYDERVNTLIEDGVSGFILVCLVLTLFLQLRVALWAGVGIFTSILGALWFMPMLDVSLNMLSLFGFLLAMGILVDDAIIIGESIFSLQEQGQSSLQAAINGVQSVALPVVLAVLVSLVAFLPSLFLPGWAGRMMQPICIVMILTLVFSLVEALLILPSHLAAPMTQQTTPSKLAGIRAYLNQVLDSFVDRYYRPFLQSALQWRYLTIAGFIVLLMLCVAWVHSGRIRLSLQADVVRDSFWVSLTSPEDLPYSEVQKRAKQVEHAFFALRDKLNAETPNQPNVVVGLETVIWEHGAGFWTEFSPEGRQRIKVEDFINEWRDRVGDLGRTKIDFLYKEGDVDYELEFDLAATDPDLLPKAAEQLKTILASYAGVYDVVDSEEAGRTELQLSLKPSAEHIGLRLDQLSEQVHHAYYGDEVERLPRGRNEVKIMVRYPHSERQSLDALRALPVQLPDGQNVPLGTVAEVSFREGVSKIIRQDRRRIVKVQARVDTQKIDVNALYDKLVANELKTLQQRYTGLNIDIGQSHQEQQTMMSALQQNTLISLLVIYALIAVPFRSYTKPLIFLLAAPVAWCGAVIAHGIAGLPLSMESLVGMVAASGVVVNDSLVLLDYLRENNDSEQPISELICAACTSRFRPIFLAFLTNFAGFLPTLLETSPQAQFLIPMTLSLSAGLLLGMSASLLLTPVCYAVLEKN